MPKKWWEREPLRFECQPDCFKCCVKPGMVYFEEKDIQNAARHLKWDLERFRKEFLIREDGYWVHRVENDQPCSFLTPTGCGIHSVKPKQCRTYPFWKENLTSRSMWRLVGAFCPGIDTGPMVPVETIKKYLKMFRL